MIEQKDYFEKKSVLINWYNQADSHLIVLFWFSSHLDVE